MSGFTVAVDHGNPGQLFACCGLLEAADRRWRDEAFVTGHFEGDHFCVSAPRELDALLGWLLQAEVKCVEKDMKPGRGSNIGRVELTYHGSGDDPAVLEWPDGSTWRLNSWSGEDYGRTRLKTFAGQMKGPKVVAHLLDWMRRAEIGSGLRFFDLAQSSADASVFGFDARKGRAALDFGFSPDAIGLRTEEFPAVELFAAIGLQSFRPAEHRREQAPSREPDLLFGLWTRPLPVELARAVAGCAFWPPGERRRCRFRLSGRKARSGVAGAPNDQYKAFTRAVVETLNAEGDEDE
jgi:CRISPR-associated protein Csx14